MGTGVGVEPCGQVTTDVLVVVDDEDGVEIVDPVVCEEEVLDGTDCVVEVCDDVEERGPEVDGVDELAREVEDCDEELLELLVGVPVDLLVLD